MEDILNIMQEVVGGFSHELKGNICYIKPETKKSVSYTHLDVYKRQMFERNYFGMMMVETGDADAFITGLYTKYSNTIKVAKEVIGIRPEYKHFGTMHILNSKKGTYFLADTLINRCLLYTSRCV